MSELLGCTDVKDRLTREHKGFTLFDEIPDGWTLDHTCGPPLHGYAFATDGRSILRGGSRALVRVAPAQKQLFYTEAASRTETTAKQTVPKTETVDRRKQQSGFVFTQEAARTVNELARQQFKMRLLNDIRTDLMICEIEGWCKTEYLDEIRNLINSIGRNVCIDA